MTVTGRSIVRLILTSGLALLLSGCYAATGNYAYTPASTYASHDTYYYAPSGHARYGHTHHYRAKKAASRDRDKTTEIRTAAQGPKPPRTASGHGGRGDESIAVATARDEGPRPGAEGGAR